MRVCVRACVCVDYISLTLHTLIVQYYLMNVYPYFSFIS